MRGIHPPSERSQAVVYQRVYYMNIYIITHGSYLLHYLIVIKAASCASLF